MKVVFLGTASCFPTPARGVSCTALQLDSGELWLFDCGEGSQVQLQRSSLKAGKVTRVFITHLHGDHLFGLPGLLCTLGNGLDPARAADTRVEVIGPLGLRKFLAVSLGLARSPLPFQLAVVELEPRRDQYPAGWVDWKVGEELEEPPLPQEASYRRIACTDGRWRLALDSKAAAVEAAALAHRVPSFGFVVTEAAAAGRLDTARLLAAGIRPGPIYGRLKAGEEVAWEGAVLRPADFLGPEVAGRRVAVLGDTSDSTELVTLVGEEGLDLLCHEATMEEANRENALKFGHSTPAMAVQVAAACRARHLALFHLSARYKPISLSADPANPDPDSAGVIVAEARRAMAGLGLEGVGLTVAEDFTEITVPRTRPARGGMGGSEVKMA